MPRSDGAFPHRPPPPGPFSEMARRAGRWLLPRLGEVGGALVARFTRFVEGDEARTLVRTVWQGLRKAARWAWRNDTVPADAVKKAVRRHETRLEQAEIRRAQREVRRQQLDDKRKAKERRYAEKSAIYLG